MKSKILKLYDYKDFPIEKKIRISCPREYLDGKLKCVARKYKTFAEAKSVEKRDVLTLDLKSDTPKFNGNGIVLTVCSGLFDADFENRLVGMALGENADINVNGVAVNVVIRKISRGVYPQVTDAMIAEYIKGKNGYDGVNGVDEFCSRVKALYIEEEKKNHIGKIAQDMYCAVLDNSEFYYDPEELEKENFALVRSVEDELKEENLSIDTISYEKCREYFGVNDSAELRDFLLNNTKELIASGLWLLSISGIDTDKASLDDADNLDWSLIYDYINDNIEFVEE